MNQNKKVTDPKLLEQLEGRRVKDTALLAQLNQEQPEDAGAYLDNLPELPGFFSKLPRNILIGLAHAGRNAHNAPHDVAQGIESRLGQLGDAFNGLPGPNFGMKQPASSYLPNDTQDYSQAFGGNKDANTLMDDIIQGAFEHAPELIGLHGIAKAGLRKFPITKGTGSRRLNEVDRLISERNVPNIPLTNQSIDESINYLPKTHATRELLQAAERGEYNPSFSLQSQIGKHQRDLAKSPLASERLLAPKVGELRQRIIDELETGLRALGHNDIADLLKGGLDDYRKYIKFKEKVKPVIKNLGIPTTALTVLGLGTNKGRKLVTKLVE